MGENNISNRALARNLKLPVILNTVERVPVQNGLKLYKNGHFLPVKKQKLSVKMTGMTGPS